jgi:hypothetical protein
MTRPESDLVSGEELARWLGLSGKEVYDLEKAGIIVRVGRAYHLEGSARRYCEHLRRTTATEKVLGATGGSFSLIEHSRDETSVAARTLVTQQPPFNPP